MKNQRCSKERDTLCWCLIFNKVATLLKRDSYTCVFIKLTCFNQVYVLGHSQTFMRKLKTINFFRKTFLHIMFGRVLNMPLSVYLVKTISSLSGASTNVFVGVMATHLHGIRTAIFRNNHLQNVHNMFIFPRFSICICSYSYLP